MIIKLKLVHNCPLTHAISALEGRNLRSVVQCTIKVKWALHYILLTDAVSQPSPNRSWPCPR